MTKVKQEMQMIIWMDQPLANVHLDGLASCKSSSGWISPLRMIIHMERPLAIDDWMDRPLANDTPFPFLFSSLLQEIHLSSPLVNDHLDELASCK